MSRKTTYLPYGRQSIDDDDVRAVSEALKSDFLTTGPRVAEFEAAFANATGAKFAVACNSGTAALHLATMAVGLGPTSAAVVPTLTFLATANAVRMTGAEVVFADVDPETGLLTPDTLAEAVERGKAAGLSIRAALPVHLNGQLCDMAAIGEMAREHKIALIADACHALGLPDVGATEHTLMACFSTHPVKAIATGEGGLVTTAEEAIAARMRRLRSHGMSWNAVDFQNRELAVDGNEPNPWYYEMDEIGWNYRLPDVLCALGISQLGKLERFFRRRTEIAARYDELLAPLAPAIRPVPHARPHGWHLYVVLIDFELIGTTRRRFMQELRARRVGSQVHYLPVHLQPYYRIRYGDQRLKGAERYYSRCLSIPMFPAMTDSDVQNVVSALHELATGQVGR